MRREHGDLRLTIRRQPEDFHVSESLATAVAARFANEWSVATPLVVYRLTKTSLTTPEATVRLAKLLRVRPGDVQHAGLKDKHAVTEQHVTVKTADVHGARRLKETVDGPALAARRIAFASEHASAEWIGFNAFRIVVRDLSRVASEEMDRRAALLGDGLDADSQCSGPHLLVTNYFGDQRFGSARHGQGFAGAAICRGDYETALKLLIGTPARKDSGVRKALTRALAQHWGTWDVALEQTPRCPPRAAVELLARGGSFQEAFAALPHIDQRMAVEAYQSHLWNRIAAACMLSVGEMMSNEDHLVFARASAVGGAMRAQHIAMPAASTLYDSVLAPKVQQVLADERLTLDQLRVSGLRRPSFDSFERSLMVHAKSWSMSSSEVDELTEGGKRLKRTVAFALPSGAYATVVLRALGQ